MKSRMKPVIKELYDAKGNHVDNIAVCGHCGTFICYPEEHGKSILYRYCTHCGMPIDWKGGQE